MRRFGCSCGNVLFFDSTRCIGCGRVVGWCPWCAAIRDVDNAPDGYRCRGCGGRVEKCANWEQHGVCNRFVGAAEGEARAAALCDCCRFNRVIPDLSVAGNREKWGRLEAAKRRALYNLLMVGLPYGDERDGVRPALRFDFKSDVLPGKIYRDMAGGEKVYTGHADGLITINLREADDVTREKLRVALKEPQRSLLGHFRHELGHYVWDVLVKGRREGECIQVFGDHRSPTYAEALDQYYKDGPRKDWHLNYVSAYATMHPWEDFAETFAVYLDMTAALDTAVHFELAAEFRSDDLPWMIAAYQRLGIALNEMNRSNGLLDYLPEILANPIAHKLRFVHSLARDK